MRIFTTVFFLLFFPCLNGILAQTRIITGKVISMEDKNPIPGVTVYILGTTIGTTTGPDGNYTLGVPEKYKVLVFSFVGLKTQEITIGESDIVNTVMQTSVTTFKEVVVTALGISRDKKSLGYATQEVSGDEIEKI